jgi:ectoine hydroxylase-related dioxygenase (phytanoyl-CoA dioxygenase family)
LSLFRAALRFLPSDFPVWRSAFCVLFFFLAPSSFILSSVAPADLSAHHAPLTGLFPRADSAAERARYRLSAEQLAHFEEHGYVQGIRVLDDAQLAALRGELAELTNPDHPGRHLWYEFHSNESRDPLSVLFHALGAWRIAPAMHDLLWHPAVTVRAAQLLGGGVRFWHDQLFCKPARHGGIVAWHQDFSYWTRTQPMAHLTCWIGLDAATRDNGCLHYVPGSHRWRLLPRTGLANRMDAIFEILSEKQKEAFRPVAIELAAGEAAFHHPLIVHGSHENRTDGPRRAVVLNFMRDGVLSASDEPLLAGVPPVPAGKKIEGPFFPLLYVPAE